MVTPILFAWKLENPLGLELSGAFSPATPVSQGMRPPGRSGAEGQEFAVCPRAQPTRGSLQSPLCAWHRHGNGPLRGGTPILSGE